jgi:hypothetical protein
MSKPSPWWMLSSSCLCLNQYHEEFPNILPKKGVGLTWDNSTTFNFGYCKLIDSPTSCIAKTQTTIAWSSSLMHTYWPKFPRCWFAIQVIRQWNKRYVPMLTCLPQWNYPTFKCIHGLLQCFANPFTSNLVNNVASIKYYLFLCWFLCRRWWDIFFVLCWLLLLSILPPLWHI